jgi:ribonuclease HII
VNLQELSLAELRARVREAPGAEQRQHLEHALRDDPRAGARRLSETLARARERELAERVRVQALFEFRGRLQQQGARLVAGVDEVGMGPLAGPVVAAAVVLPEAVYLPGLDDSKRVTRARREELARRVHEQALGLCIAEVDEREIDRLNIYRAGLEAMRRAVLGLGEEPDHVVVDARTIPGVRMPQTAIVGGDALDGSIAAASIVAKVYRDAQMQRLDAAHPGYGFAQHKGYPTPEHLAALRRLGPSPIHRRSFAPVAQHQFP